MPICAICGEDSNIVTQCKMCGEEFCPSCGDADDKVCTYCGAEGEDFIDDDED
ncbi:MAG: hypothetical protein NWE89_13310 [Candidatus Bathyarchaeota archaeon]|nr:hypothetical protein [Candidatus Bathyarchaeota archaeon]